MRLLVKGQVFRRFPIWESTEDPNVAFNKHTLVKVYLKKTNEQKPKSFQKCFWWPKYMDIMSDLNLVN